LPFRFPLPLLTTVVVVIVVVASMTVPIHAFLFRIKRSDL
jgi:hypothetical protein